MAFINPLDLETIFLSLLAGNPFIFYIIGIIFILLVAGYFKMPNSATGLFCVLFTVIAILPGMESANSRMIGLIAMLIIGISAFLAIRASVTKQ